MILITLVEAMPLLQWVLSASQKISKQCLKTNRLAGAKLSSNSKRATLVNSSRICTSLKPPFLSALDSDLFSQFFIST